MPSIETKRLFFAIELPSGVKQLLASIQNELKKTGADAKWVSHENIHLTLKFLGNVEIKKIDTLKNMLNQGFGHEKKFIVTLYKLGAFPSLTSARVIWAGLLDQAHKLKNLASAFEEALSKLGFEKEEREFQVHATLARIRSHRNRTALAEQINELNQNFHAQDLVIDNITLFESQLTPGGSIYSIIHQVKFC